MIFIKIPLSVRLLLQLRSSCVVIIVFVVRTAHPRDRRLRSHVDAQCNLCFNPIRINVAAMAHVTLAWKLCQWKV